MGLGFGLGLGLGLGFRCVLHLEARCIGAEVDGWRRRRRRRLARRCARNHMRTWLG